MGGGVRKFVCLLVLLFILTPVLADQEILYAQDWTSSVTIANEGRAYGAFNDSTATFSTFTTDGQVATAALINNTVQASGTFNAVTYSIRMSSNGGFNDDYFTIQYWDSGTNTWYSNATTIRPGTGLTTYGPYAAPQIGSFAEADNIQVRIIFERVTGADNIVMNIDGVEVTVDYTPADTVGPEINFTAPGNDTWYLDGTVLFQFRPYDVSGIANCTLWIDGAEDTSNTSITNGAVNNLTTTLADGTYLWAVSCIDSSVNNNQNFTSVNRTIRIDTTGPQTFLESPANNNISSVSDVTFEYNTTDVQTTIASCDLITNDTVRDTDTSVTEGTTQSFLVALTNGFYEWWVNCTDSNGFETESARRNITINTTEPTIVTEFPSYMHTDTVLATGQNFNASIGVTINWTLANGTVISNTTTSNGAGEFNDAIYLPYDYLPGTYTLFAYETADISQNASTTFDVSSQPVTADVNATTHKQGDEINITGALWPPNDNINITITFNDSSTMSFIANANTTGGFLRYYNLSYSAPLNLATVFAYSLNYSYINATDTFTIVPRIAMLSRDQPEYLRDENVNIFGYNFSRLELVTLTIYDNITGDIGPTFPVNKSTDDTGYFTHIWNTMDTCNGVYRVEANDTVRSYLNASTYFTINASTTDEVHSLPIAGSKFITATPTLMSVALINSSNEQDESLNSNTKSLWYFEVNFTNALSDSLTLQKVEYHFEHANSGTFGTPVLTYFNGTGFEVVGCADLNMNEAVDHTDICDITSLFSTPADLANVTLRITAEKTSGPSATWTMDFAQLNITSTYEPDCTYFNGSSGGGLGANPPTLNTILLEDALTAQPDELDLTAGTTTFVTCNLTMSDADGYTDISTVNATLYSDTVALASPDNNRTHYTNTSCLLTSGIGNNANYTCGFNVYYYAINGSWTCSATIADSTDVDTETDNATMNQLYALNISLTEIDYGDFQLGQTSAEQVADVSNIGNARINVSAYGYALVPGDDLAMNCTENNISVGSQRYALSSGTFASKSPLSGSLSTLGLLIDEQQSPGTPPSNQTYWQLEAPVAEQPQGNCTGILVFQAEPE